MALENNWSCHRIWVAGCLGMWLEPARNRNFGGCRSAPEKGPRHGLKKEPVTLHACLLIKIAVGFFPDKNCITFFLQTFLGFLAPGAVGGKNGVCRGGVGAGHEVCCRRCHRNKKKKRVASKITGICSKPKKHSHCFFVFPTVVNFWQ